MADMPMMQHVLRWTHDTSDMYADALTQAHKDGHCADPRKTLAEYRTRLLRAQRFRIHNDFLGMAAAFQPESLKTVLPLFELARIPYTDVWLEFDGKAYFDHMHAIGMARANGDLEQDVRESLDVEYGVLLQAMDPHKRVWRATQFYRNRASKETDAAFCTHYELWFSTDPSLMPAYDGSLKRLLPDYPFCHSIDGNIQMWWLGYTEETCGDLDDWIHLAPHVQGRADPILRDLLKMEQWYPQLIKDPLYREQVLKMSFKLVTGNWGFARFYLTVLALINQSFTRTVYRPSQGAILYRSKRLPYLGYNDITIEVPNKRTIVRYVRKFLDIMIRKRAHKVRGHWRHYKTGERVWIDEHQRGDASLGYVQHDYEVTTP